MDPGHRRRTVLRSASLVGVFVVLGLPWLRRAWTALPVDDASEDAWLIVWVLEWVRHALGTEPTRLFDPPVNWPAPRQLTGSEHFLSTQLAYAPLRWLTGNAVAAANLTAWLSYGLAAAAMNALLLRLGIAPAAAFVVALAYGFGWHGTPGRLHVLQSQHVYLPLIALALHRLRERPGTGRALVVAAVTAAALLSSYHMAVYAGVAAALWGMAELVRRGPARGRYLGAAAVAGAVAVATLVLVSLPYLARPEARGEVELVFSRWKTSHLAPEADDFVHADLLLVVRTYLGCALGGGQRLACVPIDWLAERIWTLVGAGALAPFTLVLPLLVLAGMAGAVLASKPRRGIVVAGVAFLLAGLLLYGPESVDVGGVRVPFPRTLVAASPARFIRVPQRALVLSFFGAALVTACGLDLVLARLARPLRVVLASVLAVAVVVRVPPASSRSNPDTLARWGRLAPVRWLENPALGPDADGYAALAGVVRGAGTGPLLDLPETADGAAVLGQTIHGQPSVDFYTGYLPPHVSIVQALIAALPDAAALDDLIDMTRLRWIVLRPEREWPDAATFRRYSEALARHPRARGVREVGAFRLLELDPTSRHPEWYRSLAAGPRRGFSALGTPLAPLPSASGARLDATAPPAARASAALDVRVIVANQGTQGWPAALPAKLDAPLGIRLELRWTPVDEPQVQALRRDLPAGEALAESITTKSPERPGRYVVEVAVRQVDAGELASTGIPIEVLP